MLGPAAALNRLHRRAARDARVFEALSEEQRHRLRKRLKRLRYVADALAPLFPRKRVAAYLAALRAAQEALGRGNDAATALALYRADVAERPQAWFAVGWLTAQAPALAADSRRALGAWRDTRRFWR
jgi:triphosphatase